MSIIEAIILGLVQGLTEFIPVSSSGHLVLLHKLFGNEGSSLGFDVALHIGTFLALLIMFRKDVVAMTKSIFVKSDQTRLAWLIAAATVPAAIGGFLFEETIEAKLRSPAIVAVGLIIVGVLMILAERYSQKHTQKSNLNNISLKQVIIIGLAQTAAIIPGTSRSGSTITAGIFAGLDRVAATRYSFLLAIPITFGAIAKVMTDSATLTQAKNELDLFIIGIVTALTSGLFAIKFLLDYLSKHSLGSFAYYRIILGMIVLIIVLVA